MFNITGLVRLRHEHGHISATDASKSIWLEKKAYHNVTARGKVRARHADHESAPATETLCNFATPPHHGVPVGIWICRFSRICFMEDKNV